MNDKVFPKGIFYKEPSDKAPNYVVGGILIKKSELIPWLEDQEADWIRMKIMLSKAGKAYIELDTFKPEKKDRVEMTPKHSDDDLPF